MNQALDDRDREERERQLIARALMGSPATAAPEQSFPAGPAMGSTLGTGATPAEESFCAKIGEFFNPER